MTFPGEPLGADPMEDFLVREKAALEALESVEIRTTDDMQIDEPVGQGTKSSRSSLGGGASPSVSAMDSPIVMARSPVTATSPVATQYSVHSPAPLSTSTPTSTSIFASNGLNSPATPRGRPETAAMRLWKTEQARRIAERDAAAEQIRQKRRQQAKQDLEQYRASWREEVEGHRQANREAERSVSGGGRRSKPEWDAETPTVEGVKVEWDEVKKLIDVLPKPPKDCSRLLSIVKTL